MEMLRWKEWNGGELGEHAWRRLAQAFAMPALLATPPRALSSITLAPSRLPGEAREKLAALLGASGVRQQDGERARRAACSALADVLRLRAGDASLAPDAVLYPRDEADVLGLLKLCDASGIAVSVGGITPALGGHASVVALNLFGLSRVAAMDTMSGLADIEAGISGAELEHQLAARGMMLPETAGSATLGGWIAQSGARRMNWLQRMRVATPKGLLTGDLAARVMPGSRGALGVITGVSLRIHALPESQEMRGYLFPDFASGLAALRQAQRIGLPHTAMRLADDGATRLARAWGSDGWDQRLFDAWLALRRFDGHAARLTVGFSGDERELRAARKRFDLLAKKLGALALGVSNPRPDFAILRDSLLDRGAALDGLDVSASWSELPALYVAVRAALKQAMRAQAPLPGAHGLVLCQVGPAWPEGANLRFTWLFPRKLEDEITQAEGIRRAALEIIALHQGGGKELEAELRRALKQVLDPGAILNPGLA